VSAETARNRSVSSDLPVARVAVDVSLPHLDRPFDYLVPAAMSATAVPGVRVRVRFAGTDSGGFVLDRVAASEHAGPLTPLSRVVSTERVLFPEIVRLAREVADRYAGTLSDVLRLAVPPRHARVEAEPRIDPQPVPSDPGPGPWASYPTGTGFISSLVAGRSPRAVYTALPVPVADPFQAIAHAMVATLASGRGALAVVPQAQDATRLDGALTAAMGPDRHVLLTAELGPAERYRRWLRISRRAVWVVIGTRAAMWAPVADLGLVVCWDDGDDLHAEPHAPYPHVREVLLLRAYFTGAGMLLGGHHRTTEAQLLVERGWLRPLEVSRRDARRMAPRVRLAGDDVEQARDPAARLARLPSLALRAARTGLVAGPVLVQVASAGYVPALACANCRTPARCVACHGPLGLEHTSGPLRCQWCARVHVTYGCPACGGTAVRADRVGVRRTAEELGRAFPGVPVRVSGRGGIIREVGADRSLVVSTPGAEPRAADGYAAALLLDGDLQLSRPSLRAAEEAVRRWMGAACLVRPQAPVVLVADARSAAAQALVRWDVAGFAARELADRAAAHLPPAAAAAEVDGLVDDVADFVTLLELPDGAQVLGPLPVPGDETRRRALVRAPAAALRSLSRALHAAAAIRSAGKRGGPVRVRVDPIDLA
jgi:primosomal protein N' (replication factor Y) (superfamily II helicase)